MINKLDERLKKYSHKYFVKEFMKCKPNTEYNRLENKQVWALVSFCISVVVLILLLICSSRLSACWYWYPLCLILFSLVYAFFYWKLECRKMMVLSGMAAAYLDTQEDFKKRVQDYALLTTCMGRKRYTDAIENTYRADIVKQCLGNDYNISTIEALKDEISINGIKFKLEFGLVCSLVALSITIANCLTTNIQEGCRVAIGVLFFLVLFYFISHGVRLVTRGFIYKKYKILRETLSFMLYNYM